MHIAIFAWEALEGIAVGGGAVYASRLAAALARAGHRVRLFTRMGEGQAPDEVVGEVMVRRCPWDRKRGFVDEIEALADSFAHYYADSIKAEGGYDLIHCHEWFTVNAGLKARSIAPARLAVSFHSTEWARTGVWPDSGDSARIAGMERNGVENADTIIAASYWARRKIAEQFHPPDWKCEVVYHGADLDMPEADAPTVAAIRRNAGMESDAPFLLFAGRFSQHGGGDIAARACGLVAETFPDARFAFAGAGALEESMRRDAGPNAVFLSPHGRAVLPEYYQAVDLVLAPFRRDHNGRAVMPAWAASKPVITLRGTVPSEFIMHETNGWVVNDDPIQLAAVIINAFTRREQTAWMGRNGRVAAETAFSWDETAKRLLAAYTRKDRLAQKTIR